TGAAMRASAERQPRNSLPPCGGGLGRGSHPRDRGECPHRHQDSGRDTPPPPLAGGGWGEGANHDWPRGMPPPPNPLPQGEGEFLFRRRPFPDAYGECPPPLPSPA